MLTALALAAAGCGGGEVAADEVPGQPAGADRAERQRARRGRRTRARSDSSRRRPASADATATAGAGGDGRPERHGGRPRRTAAPEDTAQRTGAAAGGIRAGAVRELLRAERRRLLSAPRRGLPRVAGHRRAQVIKGAPAAGRYETQPFGRRLSSHRHPHTRSRRTPRCAASPRRPSRRARRRSCSRPSRPRRAAACRSTAWRCCVPDVEPASGARAGRRHRALADARRDPDGGRARRGARDAARGPQRAARADRLGRRRPPRRGARPPRARTSGRPTRSLIAETLANQAALGPRAARVRAAPRRPGRARPRARARRHALNVSLELQAVLDTLAREADLAVGGDVAGVYLLGRRRHGDGHGRAQLAAGVVRLPALARRGHRRPGARDRPARHDLRLRQDMRAAGRDRAPRRALRRRRADALERRAARRALGRLPRSPRRSRATTSACSRRSPTSPSSPATTPRPTTTSAPRPAPTRSPGCSTTARCRCGCERRSPAPRATASRCAAC